MTVKQQLEESMELETGLQPEPGEQPQDLGAPQSPGACAAPVEAEGEPDAKSTRDEARVAADTADHEEHPDGPVPEEAAKSEGERATRASAHREAPSPSFSPPPARALWPDGPVHKI